MEEQIFFVKKIVLWSWKGGGGGFSPSQLLHQIRRDLRIWGGEGEICRRVKKLLLAGVHLLQLLESGVWRPLFLGHKHQFYLYRFSWLPPPIVFSEFISLCIFFNYFSLEATTIIINFSWYWLSVQLGIFQLLEYFQRSLQSFLFWVATTVVYFIFRFCIFNAAFFPITWVLMVWR